MNHVDREWIRAWRQERDRDRRRVAQVMTEVSVQQRRNPQAGPEPVGKILQRMGYVNTRR